MFRYISQQRQIIRSYYSGIGKTAVIYPASFLVSVASVQVGLGLIFFTRDVFRATPTLIGWLSGVWSISYVFGCLFVRPAFNRVPPHYLIMGSCFCMFVFVLSMQFAPSMEWIYLLYGLFGLAQSLFWPPLMAWLSTDTEGTALGQVISRFNLAWCAGTIVGPFVCGWLSERATRLPIHLGSSLFLLTGIFVAGAISALPRSHEEYGTVTNLRTHQTVPGRSTLLCYPAWIGLFATYFNFGVILAVFPIAVREELLLTETTIGFLFLIRALFNAMSFVILGKTLFWHFRSVPMLVGQLLGAAVFIGLANTGSVYTIGALLALLGISHGMSYSISIFHGVSGSLNRAQRMAIHESIIGIGTAVGPVLGGMVYESFTIVHVYRLCAIVLLAGTFAQLALCAWAYIRDGREKRE